MIKARTSRLAVSIDKNFLTREKLRTWQNADLQTGFDMRRQRHCTVESNIDVRGSLRWRDGVLAKAD